MLKYIYILILLSIFYTPVSSQTKFNTLTIQGSANLDSGRIVILPLIDKSLYPIESLFKEYPIIHGQFIIKDTCSYPIMVRVGIKTKGELVYVSDCFFLEPGIQNLSCDISLNNCIPKIDNSSMIELRTKFLIATKEVDEARNNNDKWYDSVYLFYKKKIPDSIMLTYISRNEMISNNRKSILLDYVTQNPSSYVSMWEVIKQLKNGYDPMLASAYLAFKGDIRQTLTAKNLRHLLIKTHSLSLGNIFPSFQLLDQRMNSVKLKFTDNTKKFYFIDFWFSHCIPCIGQFTSMKKIYSSYHMKGLEIINISVDKSDQIPNWKKIIQSQHLIWQQLLDKEGKLAEKYSITSFPTNFLLDRYGKIIRKNIEMVELLDFLKENTNDK